GRWAPGLRGGRVLDEGHVDAGPGEGLGEEVLGAAVEAGRGDQVVAGLRDVEDGKRGRGLAAGEQQGTDAALEVGDAVLHDLGGRVADAGVDGTEVLEVEAGCGDVSVVEDERGRLVDR